MLGTILKTKSIISVNDFCTACQVLSVPYFYSMGAERFTSEISGCHWKVILKMQPNLKEDD
jgi:hypothetical protein